MSLINDALRRANSDKSREPHKSAPVPPMQPVEPKPSSFPVMPVAVLVVGLGVLGIAAAFWFGRSSSQTQQITQNETPATPITAAPAVSTPVPQPAAIPPALTETKVEPQPAPIHQPISTPSPTPAPALQVAPPTQAATTPEVATKAPPAAAPEVKPAPQPTEAAHVAQVSQPANPPASSTTPAPTAEPPAQPSQSRPPRLQAIYYRLKNPTVVLNGKTVAPGQYVDGIRVVSIQRTSVEVVQDGKYRTLTLQDN